MLFRACTRIARGRAQHSHCSPQGLHKKFAGRAMTETAEIQKVIDVFRQFDLDGSGRLPARRIFDTFLNLGCFQGDELHEFLMKFAINENVCLDYRRLVADLFSINAKPPPGQIDAVPIILVSDPGQDLDDEMAFIMLKHLLELGTVEIRGIITTLTPAFDRARLCRGTLDILGLFDVPVGVGSDGGDTEGKHKASTFVDWAWAYLPPRYSASSDAFLPGRTLLHKLYADAGPRSITLVIIASLKDPALFLRDHEALFKAKTREVIIMGGVEDWKQATRIFKPGEMGITCDDKGIVEEVRPDSQAREKGIREGYQIVNVGTGKYSKDAVDKAERSGADYEITFKASLGTHTEADTEVLVPDTANNNTFDMNASRFFHKRCQELGVPLLIVSRWPAYAAKVPRSIYDDLASTGSWIGCRLRNAQRASIESLWARAASPAGSAGRAHLPDRCDRTWFLRTFCAGAEAHDRSAQDTIWDLITGFMQYDTIAVLAAVPSLRNRYFRPTTVTGMHGVEHQVIGCTEEEHGILDTDGLSRFLNIGFKKGLAHRHVRKAQFILVLQPRWANRADSLLACVVFRALFELGVFDCAGIICQPSPNTSQGEEDHSESGQELLNFLSVVGLSHVPVLVASPEDNSGTNHLKELYRQASPAGVVLVVTGSLELVAKFAEFDSKAFVQKTQRIVLLSGAVLEQEANAPGRQDRVMLKPEPTAQNNLLDMQSAERFFQLAQDNLVPLLIVSRHCAHAVRLPRSFFDVLGNPRYGGTVGKKLYDVQRDCTLNLWKNVNVPVSEGRRKSLLPERCDRNWFVREFCSGVPPASDSDDDVWKAVQCLNIYNLMAILMAFPPFVKQFVTSKCFTIRSVNHQVIGESEDKPGVTDISALRRLILQCIVAGAHLNCSVFDREEFPTVVLDDTEWSYDSSKDALSWLLPPECRDLAAPSTLVDLWER